MNSNILTALKGFAMGAANVVPGVSGGTIALLTGIYSKIVDSLSAVTDKATWKALIRGRFKEFWNLIGGTFLLSLGVGIILSILSLAKVMTWALDNHPVLTWAFFFGLILASSYYMFRDIKGWDWKCVLMTVAGVCLGLLVCNLTPTQTPDTMLFLFICGAIAICTMILPGISGSFILVILGKYDYVMKAIGDLDIPVILVFAAGCLVGILAFAKFLHWLLARWEKQTMLLLLGFVLGSLVKVWPWNDPTLYDASNLHIPGAVICCLLGVALVVVIELAAKRGKESR